MILLLALAAQAGLAVGLYPEHPAPNLDEVRALGAQAVLLPVPWAIDTPNGHRIAPFEQTVDDDVLIRTIDAARGMPVTLMPYLIVDEGGPGEWRGKLRPRDRVAWWRAYTRFVLHYADIAHAHGVATLVIGSELSSLQNDAGWAELSTAVRRRYFGRLAYVSNHDALDRTTPFRFVDVAGVSAYFPLTGDLDAPVEALHAAWRGVLARVRDFSTAVDRPVVLYEVGYPSIDGAAVVPWDDTNGAPIDLEEQRRAYTAVTRGLLETKTVAGVYFWIWYAPGGPLDRSYTARGKPAEAVAETLLFAQFGRHSVPVTSSAFVYRTRTVSSGSGAPAPSRRTRLPSFVTT